jgi:hypothetical protein
MGVFTRCADVSMALNIIDADFFKYFNAGMIQPLLAYFSFSGYTFLNDDISRMAVPEEDLDNIRVINHVTEDSSSRGRSRRSC